MDSFVIHWLTPYARIDKRLLETDTTKYCQNQRLMWLSQIYIVAIWLLSMYVGWRNFTLYEWTMSVFTLETVILLDGQVLSDDRRHSERTGRKKMLDVKVV